MIRGALRLAAIAGMATIAYRLLRRPVRSSDSPARGQRAAGPDAADATGLAAPDIAPDSPPDAPDVVPDPGPDSRPDTPDAMPSTAHAAAPDRDLGATTSAPGVPPSSGPGAGAAVSAPAGAATALGGLSDVDPTPLAAPVEAIDPDAVEAAHTSIPDQRARLART